MTAFLWEASTQNAFQTTLNGTINDTVQTITLTSVANLVAPGVLVIDRQDGSGNDTPSKREYISFTGINGSDLTGVTRQVAGSTAQSHSSGALVEAINTVTHWGDMVDFLQVEHASAGGHLSLASVGFISVTNMLIGGATVNKIGLYPTWYIPDNASAATTSLGRPLSVPHAGVLTFASVVLRSPVSAASIIFDINKNFTSIFEAGTRPSILGGGTFASTASLAVKTFAAGNIFNVDLDAGGEYKDVTVTLGAD